jgi:benzoylformate decarboxylase
MKNVQPTEPDGAKILAKHVLWKQLAAERVEFVFGNPGTFEQGLLDALREQTAPRYIMALQEAVVVAMATNYARLSKRCAVVQLHAGVGLGNAIGALQEALRGQVPMLVLCGENDADWEVFDGYLACDLLELGRPATKWAARISSGDQLLHVMRQAWSRANTSPRGPVLLAIPMNVLEEAVQGEIVATHLPLVATLAPESVIAQMAEDLQAAKRPLVLIGDALAWSGAEGEVLELCERLGAPLYGLGLTMAGRMLGHPQFAGFLRHTSGDAVAEITSQADLVLAVGATLGCEIFPKGDGRYLHLDARLYHIDPDPAQLGKNVRPTLGLACDPKHALLALCHALEAMGVTGGSRRNESWVTPPTTRHEAPSGQFTAAQMMSIVADAVPADALVLDESMTATEFLRNALRSRADVEYLACLSRGLGSGWPAGVAAKLLYPERAVISISADGAAMYVAPTLWTAAHLGLSIVFLVVNNHAYNILKHNISHYWNRIGEPTKSYPFMDLMPPGIRFDLLGESMGVRGWRANDEASLRAALQAALETPGSHVIDVEVA